MRKNLFIFLVVTTAFACNYSDNSVMPGGKIIIEVQPHQQNIPKGFNEIAFRRSGQAELNKDWTYTRAKILNGRFKWTLRSDQPLQVNSHFVPLRLLSPGDSISIVYEENRPTFSGRGSDKLDLLNKTMEIEKGLAPPTKNSFTITSVQDYFQWCKYADDRLLKQLKLMHSFENKIPQDEWLCIKAMLVARTEIDRLQAFAALKEYRDQSNIPVELCNLSMMWDTIKNNEHGKWLRLLPDYYGEVYSLYLYNKLDVGRKFDFNYTSDSIKRKATRTYLYYDNAKKKFTGITRERLITYILDEQTITEMGVKHPMTKELLKDYYNQPGFPEYKKWVKELEEKAK